MSPSLFEFLSGTAEREKKPKKSVAGRNANVRSIQASFCLTSSPCSQRHQTARRATEQGGVQRTGRSLMPAGGPPKGRKSSSLNMHPKIFVNMWKMILQHSHCHGTAPQWVCSFGTSLPACPPHPTHAEGWAAQVGDAPFCSCWITSSRRFYCQDCPGERRAPPQLPVIPDAPAHTPPLLLMHPPTRSVFLEAVKHQLPPLLSIFCMHGERECLGRRWRWCRAAVLSQAAASRDNTRQYHGFTHFSGLILNAYCYVLATYLASFANKTSPERLLQRVPTCPFVSAAQYRNTHVRT